MLIFAHQNYDFLNNFAGVEKIFHIEIEFHSVGALENFVEFFVLSQPFQTFRKNPSIKQLG